MGLRHRSIRLRVGILILVPVLCLIALYGFAASITLGNALTQAHAKSLRDQLLTPLTAFQAQLDRERHLAVLTLAIPNSTKLAAELSMQENATQQALSAFESTTASPGVLDNSTPAEHQAITTLTSDARSLSAIRTDVDAGAITIPEAINDYSGMISQGYTILDGAMAEQTNVPIVTQALNVITLDEVAQTALEEGDLLAGDVARNAFPGADRTLFAQLVAQRRTELGGVVPLLDPYYLGLLDKYVTPADNAAMTNIENAVIATSWRGGPPPAIVAGQGALQTYSTAIDGAIAPAAVTLENQAQHNANVVFAQLLFAAGFGLLGTIASILLSFFIGRSLVRQLRSLRESALELANERLPDVIRQLRDGQAVDVSDYEAPETETKDEIEQVQQAFNNVQRTALQSAVDEARLRRGISDVFRNLAGRSQSLLHRQLTLLDGMERRATEPDELEDLFRIDHLTTRMRRHAEGLIILSGDAPARGWRQPVPLIDVLRAAVAEVEDYTRIRVLSRTRSAVAGHAVADVIHLIAELAENATVFSPPNTPVRIQGDVVGKGFAIEIEDRGLGISPERLLEVNNNLANPPQFDLSDSDRLGLFITGQLAHRHGISVTLQPSVYGGTTAIVLIPLALVVDEGTYLPDPALPAGARAEDAGQVTGRHAALAAVQRDRLPVGNGQTSLLGDPEPLGLPAAGWSPVGLSPVGLLPAGPDLRPADLPPADLRPTGLRPVDLPPGELPPEDLPPAELRPAGLRPVAFDASALDSTALTPSAVSPSGRGPGPFRSPSDFGSADLRAADVRAADVRTAPASDLPTRIRPVTPIDRQAGDAPAWHLTSDDPADPAREEPVQLRRDEPGPFRRDESPLPRRAPAEPQRDEQRAEVNAAELAELGLPVRVRQASLAPQLRDSGPAPAEPTTPTPAARPVAGPDPAGTPEAARSTVSALQRGWQLGRAEAGSPGQPNPSDPPSQASPGGPANESTRPIPAAVVPPSDPAPATAGENSTEQSEADQSETD
jgi:signal transduction histidine kinase